MDSIIFLIINIVFWVLILGFVIASLLAIYILNTYGRTKSITIAASLLFGFILTVAISLAFINFQNILQKYA